MSNLIGYLANISKNVKMIPLEQVCYDYPEVTLTFHSERERQKFYWSLVEEVQSTCSLVTCGAYEKEPTYCFQFAGITYRLNVVIKQEKSK